MIMIIHSHVYHILCKIWWRMMTTLIHLPQKSRQLVFFPAHPPGQDTVELPSTRESNSVRQASLGGGSTKNDPRKSLTVMDSLYRLWIRKSETSNSYRFSLLCWNWTWLDSFWFAKKRWPAVPFGRFFIPANRKYKVAASWTFSSLNVFVRNPFQEASVVAQGKQRKLAIV